MHTMKSLPGREQTGYAVAAVETLEVLDGRLSVRREGRIIATQEAPPSPLLLKKRPRRSESVPVAHSSARGLGEAWRATLESPESRPEGNIGYEIIADDDTATAKPAGTFARKPTILQPSPMGEMEAGSESQGQGDFAAGKLTENGNLQDHHQEMLGRRGSSKEAPQAAPNATSTDTTAA